MKAKILSLLLVVALVLTVSVFVVVADDADYTADFSSPAADGTVVTNCPVCKQSNVTWYQLPAATGSTSLQSKHYYLPEGGINANTYDYTLANVDACLHLNGQTLQRSDNGVVVSASGNTVLDIMDHEAEAGKIICKLGSTGSTGAVATYGTSVINFHGGTIERSASDTGKRGPVYLNSSGGFHMYGGKLVNESSTAVTENGGLVYVNKGTFWMHDGTVDGGSAVLGGNIYTTTSGTVEISGGTITAGTAENGGNIYANAAINMTGGTISYGESTKTITGTGYQSYGGGNVFLTGAAAIFKMDGDKALVTEGDAALNGGNIYLMSGAKFQLVKGTVSNGAAAYTGTCGLQGGGNIKAKDGTTTVDIDGGTITGGTALRGGNIALTHNAGMDVSGDAEISVTTPMANITWLGANIFVRGTSSAAGDVILGGSCTISGAETYTDTDSDYGGNIYLHNYSNLTLKDNAVITGGKAKNGGNIYMSSATSKVMMQGGEISSGRAKGSSGTNIYMSLGTLQLSGGEICDGMDGGNSVYVNNNTNNQLTLSGAIKVDQLFIRGTGSAQANIQLEDSFTGHVQFRFANNTDEEKTFYNSIGYGTVLTGNTNVTIAETYDNTGSILVGAKVNNNPTYLDAYYATATKNLLIANYSKTDASGKTTYIEDLTEVGAGECLTLIRDMELTLSTDMIVDTNGMDATITTEGGAEVSLIDQTNTKDSTGFGKITISKDALASYQTTFDGKRYITVSNGDGTYSAHLLEAKVKSVVLRTETAGIYYNVELLCDRALEDLVQSYGVALSVQSMPDETFAELGTSRTDVRYTAIAKCGCAGVCQHPDVHFKNFESGSYTSCALNNILAANIPEGGISNDTRGQMPVYANGYVTICVDDGEELMLMTDETNKNKTKGADGWDESVAIAYSIRDVMELVDGTFSTLSPENQGYIVDFYTTWQADIQGWDLPNIKKAYQDSLA